MPYIRRRPFVAARGLSSAAQIGAAEPSDFSRRFQYDLPLQKEDRMRSAAMALCVGLTLLQGGSPALSQGTPAEPEVKVVKYDALKETVARNLGKVVLVDIWFTTCVPCLEAFPHVIEMQEKYGKSGFVIVSVSLDLANARVVDDDVDVKKVEGKVRAKLKEK